jgi:hypothetical protein
MRLEVPQPVARVTNRNKATVGLKNFVNAIFTSALERSLLLDNGVVAESIVKQPERVKRK